MSLMGMNTAYRQRRDNRDDEVRAEIKAGEALIHLIERHPQLAERYARLYYDKGGRKK